MRTSTCGTCGGGIVRLPTYHGQQYAFDAHETTNFDAAAGMRWYFNRARGALPGTMVEMPKSAPFLTLHNCKETRPLDENGRERFLISNYRGPHVRDQDLTGTGFRYSYRWPSSWAHIVEHDRGLCGARVLELSSDSELRILTDRPICPECQRRRERRRASG